MRRSTILSVCICMTAAFLFIQPVAAQWVQVASGELERDILTLGHEYQSWSGLTTSDKLRFEWSTGIIACHFYIMNEQNYNNFIGLQPVETEVTRESLTSDTFEWTITRNGETWYAVWFNPSLVPTHLSATWVRYQLPIPPIPGFPWQAVVLGLILAVSVALLRSKRAAEKKST